MLRYRRRLIVLLLAWLLLARWGHPQQDPGRGARIGDSVFLDTDNAAIKKLGAARDFLAAGQWNDAIELLRQIADQHGDNVAPTSDGRFINVQTYCDMLLSGMGPEGLKLYRTRIDPQARKWFEAGRADRDEELLRKVVQRAFASSYGDDALLLLGEWACERGDLAQARNYWQMLVPHDRAAAAGEPVPALAYPDTPLDQPSIRARLMLCSLLQGNVSRARAELQDLKRQFPEAIGEIAGQTGNLVKILSAAADEAEKADVAPDSPDISTFAFNPQRNKVLPMAIDVGAVQWQVDLVNFPKAGHGKASAPVFPDRDRSPALEALWYFPVVYNEIVFLCDEASIYAWNLRTGKPAWPVGESQETSSTDSTDAVPSADEIRADGAPAGDADVAHPPVANPPAAKPPVTKQPVARTPAAKTPVPKSRVPQARLKIKPPLDADEDTVQNPELPPGISGRKTGSAAESTRSALQDAARIFTLPADQHRSWPDNTAGIPRFTLTIDQGRLYARVGAIPSQVQHTPSTLVCLDVEQGEGKLVWMVEGDKLHQGGESWTFEGSPLAADGYVYVALRRNKPRPQANVACLDAETGRLIWNRKVCIGLDLWGHVQEISQQLLTLAEDRLYYCTNMGAVAALDARDGVLRWVQTYRHLDADQNGAALNRSQKYGPNPCLFHDGSIYVAPTDFDHILAFDAETGVQKWTAANRGEVPALLGANRGKLIVAGDDLRALDLETGEQAWPAKGGMRQSDPEGRSYGRGLLAEGLIYWPTREELLIVDQETGALKRRLSLTVPHRQGGGNLAIAHGFLLVAQHDRLTAFCDHGMLEQRYSDELARRPRSASLHYELACVQESLGHAAEAVQNYQQACALIGDSDNRELARLRTLSGQRLFDAHLRLAESQIEQAKYAEAVHTFGEALQFAPEPSQRLSALQGLAKAEERNGRIDRAVAAYQTILESHDLRPLHQSDVARRHIRELIATHGRAIYAAYEARAKAAFTEARTRDDAAAVEEAVRSFANAQVAEASALSFARESARQERFQDANRILLRLLHEDISPAARASTLTVLARMAEQRQYWHSAENWWRLLADQFAEQLVEAGGREVPAKEFVAAHLQQARFQHTRLSDSGPEIPLVQRWTQTLPADAAIMPQGSPPAADRACVLVPGDGAACVDAQYGTPRWHVPLQGRLCWSAFAGDLLILATPIELCAVIPETGERVWERRFGSASIDAPTKLAPDSPRVRPAQGQHPADTERSVQLELRSGDARASSAVSSVESGAGQARSAGAASATTQASALPRFVALDDRIARLAPDGELTLLYAHNGEQAWNFRYRTGALNPYWYCGPDWVALQAADGQRTLVLNSHTGAVQGDLRRIAGVWSAPPLAIGKDRLAVVLAEAEVLALDLRACELSWRDSRPAPQAFALPSLLANDAALLMVLDGDTLVELDRETGRRLWSRRLGSHAVRDARELATLDRQSVYVASGGVLRSFALQTGRLNWERYLGPPDQDWRVARWGNLAWSWPTAGPGQSAIVVVDAKSGEAVERFPLDRGADSVTLLPSREFALVSSGRRLVGLHTLGAHSLGLPGEPAKSPIAVPLPEGR